MPERSSNINSLQARVLCLLSQAGIVSLMRKMLVHRGRFVLGFHGVCSQRYQDIPRNVQPSIAVPELREILQWVSCHFAFLTPQEFFRTERRGVLLTFDDGLASNYRHALPLLDEFAAPAIFFISMQHILNPKDWLPASREFSQRYWKTPQDVPDVVAAEFYDGMTEQELISASKHQLITIGSHTVSHPYLPQCTDKELMRQLVDSKTMLEERITQPVDLFAYPYGGYDRRVAEAVHDTGYSAAFAVDPVPVGLPPYEIPRIDLYWADPSYLDFKLSGLFRRPIQAIPK